MSATPEEFHDHILESGYVLDPEGVHHGFVGDMHGQKLDFDKIPTASGLFEEWVEVAATKIDELYGEEDVGTIVIVSVANGTNRLVGSVAERLGNRYVATLTEKASPAAVKLTKGARLLLQKINPQLAIALEDVGKKGITSASAVQDLRSNGVPRAEVLNTWQRRPRLEALEAIHATYNSIIHEDLPTYSTGECREIGYCALGWEFIPHGSGN